MVNLAKVVVLAALATTSISVQAGNYLFPTDVLPKGDLDVQAQFSFMEFDQDISLDFFGLPLKATDKTEVTNTNLSVRYGVGSNWHIGATLPHTSSESYLISRPGSAFTFGSNKTRFSNTGNAILFAKHQFDLPESSPYTLSASAALAANTANNGYTALETTVSGGYLLNDKTRVYAQLATTFYDKESIPRNEELSAGLFYKFDENLTFVPKYKLTHIHKFEFNGVTRLTSQNLHSIGLEAQIALMPKTYLIPYFGLEMRSESKDKIIGFKNHDSDDGKTVSVSLYHYF